MAGATFAFSPVEFYITANEDIHAFLDAVFVDGVMGSSWTPRCDHPENQVATLLEGNFVACVDGKDWDSLMAVWAAGGPFIAWNTAADWMEMILEHEGAVALTVGVNPEKYKDPVDGRRWWYYGENANGAVWRWCGEAAFGTVWL